MGRGAWRAARGLNARKYSSVFVLTEPALWSRWGSLFVREAGLREAKVLYIPAGERSKSLGVVEGIAARLLEAGADRRSLLVALGGGVVGDVGGFTASTYMRGIDLVQAPTTVVAQVDSAIGGKTGVNVGAMKNLVGTFYPPRLVVSDTRVLASLDDRAFRSGLYEVVKHAFLSGNLLVRELAAALPTIRADDSSALEPLLARAAKVKVDIVRRDEREAKLRLHLNLGHTFGHALEEVTGYRRFLHGEAVGWGLLAVIRLAVRLGKLKVNDARAMASLVRRVGPLPPIDDLDPQLILALLPHDKKAVAGKVQWVIPKGSGKIEIMTNVLPALAAEAFREVQQSHGDE